MTVFLVIKSHFLLEGSAQLRRQLTVLNMPFLAVVFCWRINCQKGIFLPQKVEFVKGVFPGSFLV